MNTTALPPGIYRIEVAGGVEPECLTRESGDRVTILPLSTQHYKTHDRELFLVKELGRRVSSSRLTGDNVQLTQVFLV